MSCMIIENVVYYKLRGFILFLTVVKEDNAFLEFWTELEFDRSSF